MRVLAVRPSSFERVKPAAKVVKPVPAEVVTIPAAVGGVSSARSIGAPAPGFAQIIENGFPTQTGVKPRGGCRRQATTGTRAVQSLMTYESGTLRKMFAGANGKIFDVTDPVDATVAMAADVTGLTGNDWVSVNFATPGGVFLVGVNGADLHEVYDGAAWAANTPAITGKSSATFSFVWAYASRLWFIEKNTLSVWYLPVDSIGGAATEVSLKGQFPGGGSLLYGGTWSSDTGSGLNQKIVFVSTNGEALGYTGTDPSSSSTWSRVGVYDVAKPLGKKSSVNVGGELLMTTANGIIPLSESVVKDVAALSLAAVTKEINPAFKAIASIYRNNSWALTKWDEKNLAMLSFAGTYTLAGGIDVIDAIPVAFIVNLETGAWNSKYTGWDVQCSVKFNGKLYFGSANGRIYEAESGGSDDGSAYLFKYLEWPSAMNDTGQTKQFLEVRTTFTYSVPFNAQIGLSTDYQVIWPTAPSAAADVLTGGFWGTGGFWDLGGTWDVTGTQKTEHRWRSIGRTGYRGAVMIQMYFSNVAAPDVEIVSSEITYRTGAVVT